MSVPHMPEPVSAPREQWTESFEFASAHLPADPDHVPGCNSEQVRRHGRRWREAGPPEAVVDAQAVRSRHVGQHRHVLGSLPIKT